MKEEKARRAEGRKKEAEGITMNVCVCVSFGCVSHAHGRHLHFKKKKTQMIMYSKRTRRAADGDRLFVLFV
jgi:hypothetical protein